MANSALSLYLLPNIYAQSEDDGYIMFLVYDGDDATNVSATHTFASILWIVDAKTFALPRL